VPPSFFVSLILPLLVPMALTLILIFLVGESWPRTIAPGSGLKLVGLGTTAFTSLLAWKIAIRGLSDARARKAGALLAATTGLMGWPIWSVGFLPSINGFSVEDQRSVRMTLQRTQATPVSRSRQLNYWAWLKPANPTALAGEGRYFIPEETYRRWASEHPKEVTLQIAQGLLGARVVVDAE
jgi:hypothetical protein